VAGDLPLKRLLALAKARPAALKNSALPKGFSVFGVRCGISSKPGKKDMALFYSARPAAAAGVFTRNRVVAAPVLLSRRHLRTAGSVRAVIANSGCANACTGARGLSDAASSARTAARGLNVAPAQVLVASTGVIGRYLPPVPLKAGVDGLVDLVRAGRPSSVGAALRAIMTTDTRPKAALERFSVRGKTVTVWGCAKGAGMIHPDVATMLVFLLTDIALPAAALRKDLREAASATFNRLTVDGDTSTNDSVFLLANGAAGVGGSSAGARRKFQEALDRVCLSLSAQIAADGEGATRTAWIFVEGAAREEDAARAAATIATSPLVKTALHGADPNWGRVIAALGRAGVPFDPSTAEIRFGDVVVFRRGARAAFSEKALHKILKKDTVVIRVDLRRGRGRAHYVTCDYSKDYISINADYTT